MAWPGGGGVSVTAAPMFDGGVKSLPSRPDGQSGEGEGLGAVQPALAVAGTGWPPLAAVRSATQQQRAVRAAPFFVGGYSARGGNGEVGLWPLLGRGGRGPKGAAQGGHLFPAWHLPWPRRSARARGPTNRAEMDINFPVEHIAGAAASGRSLSPARSSDTLQSPLVNV